MILCRFFKILFTLGVKPGIAVKLSHIILLFYNDLPGQSLLYIHIGMKRSNLGLYYFPDILLLFYFIELYLIVLLFLLSMCRDEQSLTKA